MGEVGCLKDGNFQNLEVSSTFMQGGNLLKVAGYKLITSTAAGGATAAADLKPNGIHFCAVDAAANVAANNMTITLPTAGAGIKSGDFFTFVITRGSTHATGFTITTAAADKILGVVDVIHVTAADVISLANRQNTDGAARDENNMDFAGNCTDAGINSVVLRQAANHAGGAGSIITLTYVGNPDGTNAIYLATGRLVSIDPDGTNAAVFA